MSAAEVYRVYDADDRLLYIGSSVNVDVRMVQHSTYSYWWPFHARVERVGYDTIREARDAESTAIATEHPRWNVRDRSPDHPDGQITMGYGCRSAAWLRDEIAEWQKWLRDRRDAARAARGAA